MAQESLNVSEQHFVAGASGGDESLAFGGVGDFNGAEEDCFRRGWIGIHAATPAPFPLIKDNATFEAIDRQKNYRDLQESLVNF